MIVRYNLLLLVMDLSYATKLKPSPQCCNERLRRITRWLLQKCRCNFISNIHWRWYEVKVAEALKYNKKIINFIFTLIGYEQSLDCPDIISCSTLDDYVVAIKKLCNARFKLRHQGHIFQKYYSDQACTEYFKNIFNS